METLIVNSWDELQSELFADSWNQDLRRFRSRFAFRGLSTSGMMVRILAINIVRSFDPEIPGLVILKAAQAALESCSEHYIYPRLSGKGFFLCA